MNNIKQTIIENNHDSILLIISSHGDSDGVILDTDCEELSLLIIFATFFGRECPYLLDKLKIFIIDACRVSLTSKVTLTNDNRKHHDIDHEARMPSFVDKSMLNK